MRSRLCALAVSAVLALQSTGCFTVSTTEVRVRDPDAVSLAGSGGQTVLPARPAAAESQAASAESQVVLARGKYWDWLSRKPFDVSAVREAKGSIAVTCDTCTDAFLPALTGVSATDYVRVLDETGRMLPTASALVAQDDGPTVRVGYDLCMRSRQSKNLASCDVPAHIRLDVPTSDVIEVRRRVEPVRIWGYLLLGMGTMLLATSAVVAASPSFGSSFGDRAALAAIPLVPGGILLGLGGWHAFSPTQEQVWQPQ